MVGDNFLFTTTLCEGDKFQEPGNKLECKLSHGHFEEVNLLGMDAMKMLDVSITDMDWHNHNFRLVKNVRKVWRGQSFWRGCFF